MSWIQPPLPASISSSQCSTASAEVRVEKKELLAWKWCCKPGCVTHARAGSLWKDATGLITAGIRLGKADFHQFPSLPQTAAR